MDTDGEPRVDVILVTEPVHTHQHQVEVVHCRALHHPVNAARHKLKTISKLSKYKPLNYQSTPFFLNSKNYKSVGVIFPYITTEADNLVKTKLKFERNNNL